MLKKKLFNKECHKHICIICNKPFFCYCKERKFCSKKCQGEGSKKYLIIKCDYCKKEIKRNHRTIQKFKYHYCNKDCRKEHFKDIFCGKGNPNYGNKMSKSKKLHISMLNKKYEINQKQIKDLYYEGFNDEEIAYHFGCSPSLIANKRKRMGLINTYASSTFSFKEKENLEKYGITDLKHIGCFRTRTGKEKHERAKFAMYLILMELGHKVITEIRTFKGIIDVYDFTDKNIYELETNLNDKIKEEKYKQLYNEKYMNDFFIFNINEMPDDIELMIEWLKNKLGMNKEVIK